MPLRATGIRMPPLGQLSRCAPPARAQPETQIADDGSPFERDDASSGRIRKVWFDRWQLSPSARLRMAEASGCWSDAGYRRRFEDSLFGHAGNRLNLENVRYLASRSQSCQT